MKKILLLAFTLLLGLQTYAQSYLEPDTVVSINGQGYVSLHNRQFFEFSDGSIMASLFSFDSISAVVNGTAFDTIFSPSYFRNAYVLDANYAFEKSISFSQTDFFQVDDTLFGIAYVGWGDTVDLNPGGTPVIVNSPMHTVKTYAVAYDHNLQLMRHRIIHQNTFSNGVIKAISNGKIYVNVWDRDPNISGQILGDGRQMLKVLDMNFNELSSKVYYLRNGTTWNFDMMRYFIPAADGGFYASFDASQTNIPYDIALNPNQANQLRYIPIAGIHLLAKYDANLNLEWDSEIRVSASSGGYYPIDVWDSPTSDSILVVGFSNSDKLIYNVGSNSDTIPGDTSTSYMKFQFSLSKNTGQIGQSNLAFSYTLLGSGTQMLRFARNYHTSQGPPRTEYLNLMNNTFPVPDSMSAIAIYDDPTSYTPSSYRFMGDMGPTNSSYVRQMKMSIAGDKLYLIGTYRDTLRLDTAYHSTLPDYNGQTSIFIAAFEASAVVGIADQAHAFDFKVYPNPASNYLKLEFQSEDVRDIEILNIQGKVVKRIKYAPSGYQLVQIDELAAGTYFVQVNLQSGDRIGKRFVKQ